MFAVADPAGKQVYTWSWGGDNAIANAARAAGWTAWSAESKAGGPITKERVAATLAEFTDEELAAMGLTRQVKTAADGEDDGLDLSAPPPADDSAETPESGRKGRRGRRSAETDAQ